MEVYQSLVGCLGISPESGEDEIIDCIVNRMRALSKLAVAGAEPRGRRV